MLLAAIAGVAAQDPATEAGVFQNAEPLATTRSGHATVVLQDGRVLVAGGRGEGGLLRKTEIWDPASQSFAPSGSLVAPLFLAPRSILLPDGRVLLTDAFAPDPQLWDPASQSFAIAGEGERDAVAADEVGALLAAMQSEDVDPLTSIVIPLDDGRALVTGGIAFGPDSGIPRVWDPERRSLETIDDREPRIDHTATLLADGRVLVVGGTSHDFREQRADAEVFDPTSGRLEPTGSLSWPRTLHTATLLPDGRVLVVGGIGEGERGVELRAAEIWDPSTGRFGPAGELETGRIYHTATALADGRVLVVGGEDPNSADLGYTAPMDRVEIWSPGQPGDG